MKLCDHHIRSYIYHIRLCRGISPDEMHYWVGQHKDLLSETKEYLNSISGKITTDPPTSIIQSLSSDFTAEYKALLGFGSGLKTWYHPGLIDGEDNIIQLKEKLFVELQVPPEYQFLTADILLEIPSTGLTVGEFGGYKTETMVLGHLYYKGREKKGQIETKNIVSYDPNPYEQYKSPATSDNHKIIREPATSTVDTNGIILSQYQIVENEIKLYSLIDFLKVSGWQINAMDLDRQIYLSKYWIKYNDDDSIKLNDLMLKDTYNYELNDKYINISKRVKDLNTMMNMLDSVSIEKTHEEFQVKIEGVDNVDQIDMEDCNLLEIVIHVNYEQPGDAFIDLSKIYNILPLSTEIPFVKFKDDQNPNQAGYKLKNAESRLYIPAAKIPPEKGGVSKKMVMKWMGNNPADDVDEEVKKNSEDKSRFLISGKGLSYKIQTHIDAELKIPKFATVSIFKDGKIEIKSSWADSKRATLEEHVQQVLVQSASLIKRINKIQYHLPSANRRLRIAQPDVKLIPFKLDSGTAYQTNTKISLLNVAMHFNLPDLNLHQFATFAQKFGEYIKVVLPDNYQITLLQTDMDPKHYHTITLTMKDYDELLEKGVLEVTTSNPRTALGVVVPSQQQHQHSAIIKIEEDENGISYNVIVSEEVLNSDKIKPHKHIIDNFYDPFADKLLQVRYRRVNNYYSMDNIFSTIAEIRENGGNREVILTALQNRFEKLSLESLSKNYDLYISGLKEEEQEKQEKLIVNASAKDVILGKIHAKDPGIDIRVRKGRIDEGEQNRITILGCKDLYQLAHIRQFLTSFIYLYNNRDALKPIEIDKVDIEIEDDTFNLLDALFLDKKGKNKPSEEETLQQGEEEDPDVIEEKKLKKLEVAKNIVKANAQRKIFDDPKKVIGEYAPSLFNAKGGKSDVRLGEVYSRRCQKNRQPLVMTDADKDTFITKMSTEQKKLTTDLQKLKTEQTNGTVEPRLSVIKAEIAKINNRLIEIKTLKDNVDNGQPIPSINESGAHFICPAYWCFTCSIPISIREYELKKCDRCHGDKLFGRKNAQTNLGFIDNKTGDHPDTGKWCIPCCFNSLDQARKLPNYERCAIKNKPENKLEGKHVKMNSKMTGYVMDKTDLKADRWGTLPVQLSDLFDQVQEKSKDLVSNLYLREGVNNDSSGGFLSCLSSILHISSNAGPIYNSGNDIRNKLIEFLKSSKGYAYFTAMRTGYIRLLFEDLDKKLDPLEAFILFFKDNNLNEEYLWDLISAPGVLRHDGINLFILEHLAIDKTTKIVMKCPLGYDLDDLYQQKKPTAIMYKSGVIYQPIYYTHLKTDKAQTVRKFDSTMDDGRHKNLISRLFGMVDSCRPTIDHAMEQAFKDNLPNVYHEHALWMSARETITELSSRLNEMREHHRKLSTLSQEQLDKQFGQGASLDLMEQLYNRLSIKATILDDYHKIVYILLEGGLRLPVKPSARIPERDAIELDNVPDLTYSDTIEMLLLIQQNSAIPCGPVRNVVKHGTNTVIGIMVETDQIINVVPLSLEEAKSTKIDSPELRMIGLIPDIANKMISEMKTELLSHLPKDVDKAIMNAHGVDESVKKINDDQTEIDEMHKYIGRRQFEDESYNRLRFEISKYLHTSDGEAYLTSINTILSSGKANTAKRTEIETLVDQLYDILVSSEGKEIDYESYIPPMIRTVCYRKKVKEANKCTDIHCVYNPDTKMCHLFIPDIGAEERDLRETFVSLLTEELLRNEFKRNELLNDQLDVYVDQKALFAHHNEAIFKMSENLEGDEKKRTTSSTFGSELNKIYTDTVNYDEKLHDYYDMKNPSSAGNQSDFAAQDLCQIKEQPLTVYWRTQVLNSYFRTISHNGYSLCTYRSIVDALKQIDDDIYLDALKQNIATIVRDLPEINGQKGSLIYLEHMKAKYPVLFKSINDDETLFSFMTSDHNPITNIDLALISRIYEVRFIILNKQLITQNPSGMVALGTTQSLADRYILLYSVGRDIYQVIVDTSSEHGDRMVFKESQLPERLMNIWRETHGKFDDKNVIDPIDILLKEKIKVIPRMMKDKPIGPIVVPKLAVNKGPPPAVEDVNVVPDLINPVGKKIVLPKLMKKVEVNDADAFPEQKPVHIVPKIINKEAAPPKQAVHWAADIVAPEEIIPLKDLPKELPNVFIDIKMTKPVGHAPKSANLALPILQMHPKLPKLFKPQKPKPEIEHLEEPKDEKPKDEEPKDEEPKDEEPKHEKVVPKLVKKLIAIEKMNVVQDDDALKDDEVPVPVPIKPKIIVPKLHKK